jgi:DNA-binding NarL/FixJ family response regulator
MKIDRLPCLVIVEDEMIIRESLYQCFYKDNVRFERVYRYAGIRELLEAIIPDDDPVILLDVMLKGIDGIESIPDIHAKWNNARVIILSSMSQPTTISRAFSRGAIGYFDKSLMPIAIRENVIKLLEGGSPLSPLIANNLINSFRDKGIVIQDLKEREQQVLQGIKDGLSYQEIGDRYSMSIDSVRKYVKSLYIKLDVHSKTELLAKIRG